MGRTEAREGCIELTKDDGKYEIAEYHWLFSTKGSKDPIGAQWWLTRMCPMTSVSHPVAQTPVVYKHRVLPLPEQHLPFWWLFTQKPSGPLTDPWGTLGTISLCVGVFLPIAVRKRVYIQFFWLCFLQGQIIVAINLLCRYICLSKKKKKSSFSYIYCC